MKTINDFFLLGMKRNIPDIHSLPTNGVILNLGAGKQEIPGSISLDYEHGWNAEEDKIPYDDESIDGIHAYHFLEHIQNVHCLLHECQRVLKKGAFMNICVPYYKSNCAFQDLDHKHYFTDTTFSNLLFNKYYNKFGYEWKLEICFQLIIGLKDKDICLLVQLRKE